MAQPTFCNVPTNNSQAGADIRIMVYPLTSDTLMIIGGETSNSISENRDEPEINTKDNVGGAKSYIQGQYDYTIDLEASLIASDDGQKRLKQAIRNKEYVCWVKVDYTNPAQPVQLEGGLAFVTSRSEENPSDDASAVSYSLRGVGTITDLTETAEG